MENNRLNYSIYTPTEFANLMIDKTLEYYFETGYNYNRLKNLKVCDISCGNGNLLLPMLEKLIIISKKISGDYQYFENWITGYDINPQAIVIFKEKFKKLLEKYNLYGKINLFVKDGLSITNQEYDIILGNPPYLGEKNNKEIFDKIKKTEFGKKFYEGKMDYFYFFIEKSIDLLNNGGIISFLTTNYWLRADNSNKLRDYLKNQGKFIEIIDYNTSLFSKAIGQHNLIFTWKKGEVNNLKINIILSDGKQVYLHNDELYDLYEKILLACPLERKKLSAIIKNSNFFLKNLVNVNQGIVTGYDKAFVLEKYNSEFSKYLKPFYKNKDIGLYTNEKSSYWILYLDKNSFLDKNLEQYLLKFYDNLVNRREVKKNIIKWWQLQWAREKSIFVGEKIIARQRCKINQFSYDNGEFYGSADIYYITPKNENINLFYILAYLNSKVFLNWYKFYGKKKGYNYEFYSTPLKETPIYYPNDNDTIKYIENLVKLQINQYSDEIQKKINDFFIKTMLK